MKIHATFNEWRFVCMTTAIGLSLLAGKFNEAFLYLLLIFCFYLIEDKIKTENNLRWVILVLSKELEGKK